jgi:mRNA-degrading endonuclease toxin of MazEF toxin-antitoxin module
VRRGDIYTAAARGAYSGKPRPVVVIQDDNREAAESLGLARTAAQNGDRLIRVLGKRPCSRKRPHPRQRRQPKRLTNTPSRDAVSC